MNFKFPFFSYGCHRQPFYGSTAYFIALEITAALNFMPCGKSRDFSSACHLLTLLWTTTNNQHSCTDA